jgi:TRAP-type transport system periplasmic protein
MESVMRATLFALCLLSGLMTSAAAEPIEWRLAHYLPERHFFARDWLPAWIEAVESASEGRLRIVVHPNNELLRLGDIAPGIRDGKAEIGFGPAPESPALAVLGLPFMVNSATHGTRVAMHLLEGGELDIDLQGLHVVLLQTNAPSLLHSRGRPVARPQDLAGMRMRGATPGIRALLAALGSEPVEGFLAPQVYAALRDGQVDGTVFPYEAMDVFRLAEQLDYHTEVYLFVSALGLFVSQEALDALPGDLQDVIRRYSGLATALSAAQAWDDEEALGRRLAVEAGNTIIVPPPEDLPAWHTAAAAYTDDRLQALSRRGVDADALRQRIRSLAGRMGD